MRFEIIGFAATILVLGACSSSSGGAKAGTSPDGAICSAAETCAGGLCETFASNIQKVSGMCTRSCAKDADCGSGGSCVLAAGQLVCERACTTSTDCKGGLVCVPTYDDAHPATCSVLPAALPNIKALGETCDVPMNQCVPNGDCDAASKTCKLPTKCSGDAECGGYACTAGRCWISCTSASSCAVGSACDKAASVCTTTCDPTADNCQFGYMCDATTKKCVVTP